MASAFIPVLPFDTRIQLTWYSSKKYFTEWNVGLKRSTRPRQYPSCECSPWVFYRCGSRVQREKLIVVRSRRRTLRNKARRIAADKARSDSEREIRSLSAASCVYNIHVHMRDYISENAPNYRSAQYLSVLILFRLRLLLRALITIK